MSRNLRNRDMYTLGRLHQQAGYTHLKHEVQHVKREFRLTLGTIGEYDGSIHNGPRLPRKAQIREDAVTLCASLSLRLQYHPMATYIISLADQPVDVRQAILKALAAHGQFTIRQARSTGELHISQRDGWQQPAVEPELESTVDAEERKAGIYSSGETGEAEELDDLTVHLRSSVEALYAVLKPHKVCPTTQLEMFT